MMKRFQSVQLIDRELATRAGGLLSVLEGLLPVRFVSDTERTTELVGQVTTFEAGARAAGLADTLPTLILPELCQATGDVALQESRIRFADDRLVPWPFRGRTVATRACLRDQSQLDVVGQGDTVLASGQDGSPIWTVNEHGGARTFRTSLCLPDAPQGSDVGVAAAGERFIQALPLFQFLRELTAGQCLGNPPLRASYIIDDPNLHWPNYGFVDYRAIAASARRDGYHVAFATIPLDAWWVHRATAEIFQTNLSGLSLLVHGNNHAKHELAQDLSTQACSALLKQAEARIRQLEAKSGLRVARVMVPPHGACSSRMLAQLPRHGFESACISSGSLRAHNATEGWTRSLGFAPSEQVEGCPVLPRWAFSGATDVTLLAAAYLGQPLVLRGHHEDLRNGLDVFGSFARKINALGEVHWGGMGELSRLNYRQRVEGNSLRVQPLGTRVDVIVPEGVDELRIEAGGFEWQSVETSAALDQRVDDDLVVAVERRHRISIARRSSNLPEPAQPRLAATGAKLVLRRALTEVRDRLRVS